MKQIIFLIVTIFCLNPVFGQLISIKELIVLINSDDNNSEKTLNAKGFEIYKFDSTESCFITSFALNKNRLDNNADAFIAIAKFYNGSKIVSFDFKDVSHFTNEKNKAEVLGFKFVKTEMAKPGSRFHEYKKDSLILTFWTNTYTPTTQYEISLSQN